MLAKYKKAYEKIAMGLLSFTPGEKDVFKLKELIKRYEDDPNWHLYLWKEGDDFIGICGVGLDKYDVLKIQHLCVNPSHRHQGIGKNIVQEVIQHFPEYTLEGQETVRTMGNHLSNA